MPVLCTPVLESPSRLGSPSKLASTASYVKGLEERFDQTTFLGRLHYFWTLFNPVNSFYSDDYVRECQKIASETPANVTEADIYKAQAVTAGRTHPDTKELIPRLFCFSSFVPMQLPLITGLCWPNAGMGTILFWQWANQSYNAGVNYSNGGAGETSNELLAKSYCAAVGTGCGIAIVMTRVAAKMKSPGLQLLMPVISVSSAATANLFMMRQQELQTGVELRDEEGDVHGKSQIAAQEGLTKCAITRCVWNTAFLVPPAVLMSRLQAKIPALRQPFKALPVFTVISLASAFVGTYPALALYPQVTEIGADKLEPAFREARDHNGAKIQRFWYNKGL